MHDFYSNLYIIIKLKLKTGKCLIKIRFMTSVRITLQNYLYRITRTGYLEVPSPHTYYYFKTVCFDLLFQSSKKLPF